MTQPLNDKYLPVLADVLDAIDPALTEQQQMAAAMRARQRDAHAALAFALGLLMGLVKEVEEGLDVEVMATLRRRASGL